MSCRKMQVHGYIRSKHPPHRAIVNQNKTRHHSGKLLEKGDAVASLVAALDIDRADETTKVHVAQLQVTPATAEVVHDVGTRKPKRQDDTCTICRLDREDAGKCPAHEKLWKVRQTQQPGHDSVKPNEVVAAEHPIASEADLRPVLVGEAIE